MALLRRYGAIMVSVLPLAMGCTLTTGFSDFTFDDGGRADGSGDAGQASDADDGGEADADRRADGDDAGSTDGGVVEDAEVLADADIPPRIAPVDILVVLDNSNDMHDEQLELIDQFNLFFHALVDPTEGRGHPVEDLHVGVVTTDLGTLGVPIMTCARPESGDDGVLQDGMSGGAPVIDCPGSLSALDCEREGICPWMSHSASLPDDGTVPENSPLWDDFACIANLGTGGCGFEQPLEASLRALTEQARPGGPNHGFLRDGSVLVVLYVTSEDDCSVEDPEFFGDDNEVPLPTRCHFFSDLLYPVQRYSEALRGLRPREGDLLVAAIAGLPGAALWTPGEPLDLLRALIQVDDRGEHLVPACESYTGGAYLAPRLIELTYLVDPDQYLGPICPPRWTGALEEIAGRIRARVAPPG